jgi:hypothetical protein
MRCIDVPQGCNGVLNAEKCLEEMVQELDRARQLTVEPRISTRVSK